MSKGLAFCFVVLFSLNLVYSRTLDTSSGKWWNSGKYIFLDPTSFESTIGKDKLVVVNFFSKYSAESQKTAPEYDKLAEKYMGPNKERDDVIIAMLDGWNFESVSDAYGITILPEIVFFPKHSTLAERYTGETNLEKLSEFVEKMANVVQETEEDVEVQLLESSIENNESALPAAHEEELVFGVEVNFDEEIEEYIEEKAPRKKGKKSGKGKRAIPAEEPREIEVVLNTTLLQSQFEEVEEKANYIKRNVKNAIKENSQMIETIMEVIADQKKEIKDLYKEVKLLGRIADEMVDNLFLEKHPSPAIAIRQLEEVQSALNEVKDKVLEENMEEPKEDTSMSGASLFLIGIFGGAVIAFVGVTVGDKKSKRRSLYD